MITLNKDISSFNHKSTGKNNAFFLLLAHSIVNKSTKTIEKRHQWAKFFNKKGHLHPQDPPGCGETACPLP